MLWVLLEQGCVNRLLGFSIAHMVPYFIVLHKRGNGFDVVNANVLNTIGEPFVVDVDDFQFHQATSLMGRFLQYLIDRIFSFVNMVLVPFCF